MQTTISGTSVPASMCSNATLTATESSSAPKPGRPLEFTQSSTEGSFDRPVLTPTRIGVPAAPKDTGVLCMIIPAVTAAIAGNPRPTSSGTATAAGVPNPAAPSMNEPNNQAMMITCTRRSGEMLVKPARMVRSPPLSCNVFSSTIAPKIMNIRDAATTIPFSVAAATTRPGTCQTSSASAAQTA